MGHLASKGQLLLSGSIVLKYLEDAVIIVLAGTNARQIAVRESEERASEREAASERKRKSRRSGRRDKKARRRARAPTLCVPTWTTDENRKRETEKKIVIIYGGECHLSAEESEEQEGKGGASHKTDGQKIEREASAYRQRIRITVSQSICYGTIRK